MKHEDDELRVEDDYPRSAWDPEYGQEEDGMKSPAPENPTNPARGDSPDGTPSRSPKDAIWKSVIGVTGGWGCERATFYRETVRNERGYRLDFPAGEAMLFGIAVDVAHAHCMAHRPLDVSVLGIDLSDEGYGEPVIIEMIEQLKAEATDRGVRAARGRPLAEPWDDAAWSVFRERVGLAVEKLLGLWPNRTTAKGEREDEPEGTPAGPPIGWLDPEPGTTIESQRKLHAPGVVGGRGMTGKPDYVYWRDGVITAWVDVKALGRAGSYPAKWTAGEAVAYDLLCTVESSGAIPERHGYLEYRRVAKPYWALITAPVGPASLALGAAYLRRWERALDTGDIDAVSFSPQVCGGCEWRPSIAPYHAGCPIGEAVAAIAPPEQEVKP